MNQILVSLLVGAQLTLSGGLLRFLGTLDPSDDSPLDVVLAVHEWAIERAAEAELENHARVPDWAPSGNGALYAVNFYRSLITSQVVYRVRLVGIGSSVQESLVNESPFIEPLLPSGLAFIDDMSFLAWVTGAGPTRRIGPIHPTMSRVHRAAAKAVVLERIQRQQAEIRRQAERASTKASGQSTREGNALDRGERWKGEPSGKPDKKTGGPKPEKPDSGPKPEKPDSGPKGGTAGGILGSTIILAATELPSATAWADFNGDSVVDYCTVMRLDDGRLVLRVLVAPLGK